MTPLGIAILQSQPNTATHIDELRVDILFGLGPLEHCANGALGQPQLLLLDHRNGQIEFAALQVERIAFEVDGQLELVDGDAPGDVRLFDGF